MIVYMDKSINLVPGINMINTGHDMLTLMPFLELLMACLNELHTCNCINETKAELEKLTAEPDVVILHSLTNDLKDCPAEEYMCSKVSYHCQGSYPPL